MDPLGNYGQLVKREHLVELDVAHVPPAQLSVILNELGASEKARRRGHRGGGPGEVVVRVVARFTPVAERVAEVRERVSEGAHLPIEDSDHTARVVRGEHHVPEAVVAVHDRRRWRLGDRVLQAANDLLNLRDRARLGAAPLFAPAAHLAFEVAIRPAEITEPDSVVVHCVELDQRFDKAPAHRRALLEGCRITLWDRLRDDHAFAVLHDVERGAVHIQIFAERNRPGRRHICLGKGGEDAELSPHVVRRGEHMAKRRPAQHPRRFG